MKYEEEISYNAHQNWNIVSFAKEELQRTGQKYPNVKVYNNILIDHTKKAQKDANQLS